MDNLRAFDEDADFGVAADDEPRMDAPPEIGVDERRMHVRAYNYWVSLLDGRAYPSIDDLEPETLDDFGPHSVLLDFSEGAEDPAISFVGRALREECGLPSDIGHISQVPSRSLLSRLTDHYLQIIANCAPIGFEAEFDDQDGVPTMYRGILMPLSSDGDSIDFIYGVINWKELADSGTTAELAAAVDRAIAASPLVEAGPVWADGPHADAPPQQSEELETEASEPEPELDFDAGLADRLHAARTSAEAVKTADVRSRAALYRALGQAYDFAAAAEQAVKDYAELLEDAGIKAQERAPMTPVVKLVFGADYDKTRLTEFAAALSYGRRLDIPAGEMRGFLETFEGGLKAVVKAERQARRPQRKPDAGEAAREALRNAPALAHLELDSGSDEFVLLVARREAGSRFAVVTSVTDPALIDRAIRKSAA